MSFARRANRASGNTFRGWADFQLTDNIIAKDPHWSLHLLARLHCDQPQVPLPGRGHLLHQLLEAGENRNVLSWEHAHAFREDPIGTMRMNSASIIAMPVPVGAISPFDHRLTMNNPISITGCLDPNVRELTGRQDACKVHIGDYETNGSSFETMKELHEMWKAKHSDLTKDMDDSTIRVSNELRKWKEVNPELPDVENNLSTYSKHFGCGGQVLSDIYDAIWNFSGMNHSVDYQNSGSFETSARLINTMCFPHNAEVPEPTEHALGSHQPQHRPLWREWHLRGSQEDSRVL